MCLAILASYGLFFAMPVMHDDHHPSNSALCCLLVGNDPNVIWKVCRVPLTLHGGFSYGEDYPRPQKRSG